MLKRNIVGVLLFAFVAGCGSSPEPKPAEPEPKVVAPDPVPEEKEELPVVKTDPLSDRVWPKAINNRLNSEKESGNEVTSPDQLPGLRFLTDEELNIGRSSPGDLVRQLGLEPTAYFEYDSANLDEETQRLLNGHAQYLLAHAEAVLRIEGHADERGTREYNLALGERRAQAGEEYLRAMGVPASQLIISSFGEERPVLEGHNEESWQYNRRIELYYD